MNKYVNKDTPKATSIPRVDSLMSSVAVSHAEVYWTTKNALVRPFILFMFKFK